MCIMWADDNFRLEEWLAYHYYIMKLRYVVVDIDSKAKTSIDAILDRWNDVENKYNLNMTIVTMRDRDYLRNYDNWMEWLKNESSIHGDYGGRNTQYLIHRQTEFYRACSEHLIALNKSWTSYHDTDEYLTFDHQHNGNALTADIARKMEQPGYVLDRLNDIKQRYPYNNETGLACLVLRRRKFCAKEMSKEEANGLLVPSIDPSTGAAQDAVLPEGLFAKKPGNWLQAMVSGTENRVDTLRRFDTLRFKYLIEGKDGGPKSIMDLSQPHVIRYTENYSAAYSPHRVMRMLCKKEEKMLANEVRKAISHEGFMFGHYLGSFQSFSFRDDARKGFHKNYDSWYAQSINCDTQGEHSHAVRPWLRGFVKLVGGPDVASYLLQDAGKFPKDHDVTAKIHDYRMRVNNSIGFEFAKD